MRQILHSISPPKVPNYLTTDTADLNAMPAAAQMRFIRDFCEHDPLERYSGAVDALLTRIRNSKSGLKTR
jgi:hypothetical protein